MLRGFFSGSSGFPSPPKTNHRGCEIEHAHYEPLVGLNCLINIECIAINESTLLIIYQELQREIPEQQVYVTTANQHGQAVMEKCRPDDVPVVQLQLKEMNGRWKALRVIVMERQQKLEEALLALGQFQLALEELLAWINHTNQTLDKELEQKPNGDVRSIEVDMSKQKVSFSGSGSVHPPFTFAT